MIPATDLTFHIEQRDITSMGFETIMVLVSPKEGTDHSPDDIGLHNVTMPDYMGELMEAHFECETHYGVETVKADLIALGYTHLQEDLTW